jgi:hypothetical protein
VTTGARSGSPSDWADASSSPSRSSSGRADRRASPSASPLELFFVGLLVLASLAIAFVSVVVLKNLYRGQR